MRTSVEGTGVRVPRPDGFDLADAWRSITDEIEQRRTPVRARAVVHPDGVPICRAVLGTRLRIGPARGDGWVECELRGHSVAALAGEVAGLAWRLEVLDPPELRAALGEVGAQLVRCYGAPPVA